MSCGGGIRSHFLLESLRKLGEVYIVIRGKKDQRCGDRLIYDNRVDTRLGFFSRRFCSVGMLLSFKSNNHKIEEWYPGIKFDCVVSRGFGNLVGIAPWKVMPTFVDVDDNPIQKFETCCIVRRSWARRMYQALLLRFGVWWCCKNLARTGGVWLANPVDVKWFNRFTRAKLLRNISSGPAVGYNPNSSRERMIFTVGNMAYPPNFAGVNSFLNTIWPTVSRTYPDLEYLIVGGGVPDNVKSVWEKFPRVKCLGRVDDLDKIYEKSLAYVVPIDMGAGTCIKTIEGMSRSRVCLATAFGARGLLCECSPANGICVYEDATEFVNHLSTTVFPDDVRTKAEQAVKCHWDNLYSERSFYREVYDLINWRKPVALKSDGS